MGGDRFGTRDLGACKLEIRLSREAGSDVMAMRWCELSTTEIRNVVSRQTQFRRFEK